MKSWRLIPLVVALVLLVAGCAGEICPPHDSYPEIERATHYDYRSGPDGRHGFVEPSGTWVERPSLAEFLKRAIAQRGRSGLVAEYGFRCSARTGEAACADCITCTRTVHTYRTSMSLLDGGCVHYGDIYVQAHVGPRADVWAQTYWKLWRDWK